jgi:tetratricopeptide (TPR) repeat protein
VRGIILRFLRKLLKYLAIIVVAAVLVFILFSCRSGKPVSTREPEPVASNTEKEFNAVKFAQLYVDGCAERMKGNLQQALKLFDECARLDPSSVPVRYELGTIYKMLGDNERAIENARICAAADPQNEWYQLLLIHSYTANKQYPQALRIRESLVKNFPSRADFKEDLAFEYAMSGQYEKSLRVYDELEKAHGVNEQITLNKVKLFKSQKKIADVERELLKLYNSDKSEPRFLSYLAEFYFEQDQQDKAKEIYDKILVIDPDNPTVHLAYHDYYTAKGQASQAYEHLKKAFYNPELDVSVKGGILGTFYTRAEKNSAQARTQGVELAEIMLKLHPKSTEANALYADFLMLDKKIAQAMKYYYVAAINGQRDYKVWDNLLFIDNELGRFDSLERHSQLAMELFPSQPRNYLYNGVANTQLRNYGKAERSLSEGIEFVVDNKTLLVDFLRLMGDARNYTKDYPGSDKAFDEALKIDPDNTYVLNNYAYYLSQRNEQLEKAAKFARMAVDLKPNNRNYMDTYGWVLFKQGKFEVASQWLSKAASIGSPNGTILEHYGDVLYKLNKVEDAVKQWNAAREAGNSTDSLMKKIKNKKADD